MDNDSNFNNRMETALDENKNQQDLNQIQDEFNAYEKQQQLQSQINESGLIPCDDIDERYEELNYKSDKLDDFLNSLNNTFYRSFTYWLHHPKV